MSLVNVFCYVLSVKNLHSGSPSYSRSLSDMGKPSSIHYQFKKANLSYIYQKLLQCFIISSVSVPSGRVHQHTLDVPAKEELPSFIFIESRVFYKENFSYILSLSRRFKLTGLNPLCFFNLALSATYGA